MNMLVNGKVISCDTKIKKLLKSLGFKSTKNTEVEVMQFRNSITTLSDNKRVITDNNQEIVIEALLSITA